MVVATPSQNAQHGQASTPSTMADPGPSDHNQQWSGDRMCVSALDRFQSPFTFLSSSLAFISHTLCHACPFHQVQHLHMGLLHKTWIREHRTRVPRRGQARSKRPSSTYRREARPPLRVGASIYTASCLSFMHQSSDGGPSSGICFMPKPTTVWHPQKTPCYTSRSVSAL